MARAQASHPLVIAHRGASGYRPEHTLEAYRLAIALGADYVEPDLVSTADGVLVARHENEISTTTDVAWHPEFADRYTTKVIDGSFVSGWFTEDFTLAELKSVRATERMPWLRPGNAAYNGRYDVLTLDEVITLVECESRRLHRDLGLYPETKHPTYFDSVGLSLEEPLARALSRRGLNRSEAPVLIQSFETANLRELANMVNVPLVQLLGAGAPYDLVVAGNPRGYDELATPAGLAEIAGYATGVGAVKERIVRLGESGQRLERTSLVDDAHGAGLAVHAYTFRDDALPLLAEPRGGTAEEHGDAGAEYELFCTLGVDGVFTDHPDTAVAARKRSLSGVLAGRR